MTRRQSTKPAAATPEATTAPTFTPQRRTLSLARHWIDTGRAEFIIPVAQLLMDSGDTKLLTEARDMLDLLIESRQAS